MVHTFVMYTLTFWLETRRQTAQYTSLGEAEQFALESANFRGAFIEQLSHDNQTLYDRVDLLDLLDRDSAFDARIMC